MIDEPLSTLVSHNLQGPRGEYVRRVMRELIIRFCGVPFAAEDPAGDAGPGEPDDGAAAGAPVCVVSVGVAPEEVGEPEEPGELASGDAVEVPSGDPVEVSSGDPVELPSGDPVEGGSEPGAPLALEGDAVELEVPSGGVWPDRGFEFEEAEQAHRFLELRFLFVFLFFF